MSAHSTTSIWPTTENQPSLVSLKRFTQKSLVLTIDAANDSIDDYWLGTVDRLVNSGLIKGVGDGHFGGSPLITSISAALPLFISAIGILVLEMT